MTGVVWFVTGTDTGIGKTVATAAAAISLQARGGSAYVVKPAQTGVTASEPGDLDEIRRLVGPVPGHEGVRLAAALAPDAAARLEGAVLPGLEEQSASIVGAAAAHDVLVEGAGGVLVPLGDGWNLLDLAGQVRDHDLEVRFIVVARAGLGTLNHSALTVQAIRQAGLDVTGLVVGSWPEDPDLAAIENLADLPRLTGVPVLGRIPADAGALSAEQFGVDAAGWLALPD